MTYIILSQHELTTRQALRLPTGHARIFHARAGMTLIELLIVIVILTTLVAAAIPILSPSSNDRRIREASRAVNTYITAAQTKAMELRRPVGVALKNFRQIQAMPTTTGFAWNCSRWSSRRRLRGLTKRRPCGFRSRRLPTRCECSLSVET